MIRYFLVVLGGAMANSPAVFVGGGWGWGAVSSNMGKVFSCD